MARIAVPLLAVILFAGCKGSVGNTQAEASRNRKALLSLEMEMTEDEVLSIMGKPGKKERHSFDDRTIEFWLYLTEGITVEYESNWDSDYTPLAFEGGKLIGWGRNFYDRILFYRNKN